MTIRSRQLSTLGFAAGLALGFLTSAGAEEKAASGSIRPTGEPSAIELTALAKLSFQDAVKAALTAVPGMIIKAELEVEDGNLLYSFEIVGADKTITEVEIDAGNGKVLGTEIEKPKKEAAREEAMKQGKHEQNDKKGKHDSEDKD